MTDILEYRLAMAGRNGYVRDLLYRPHASTLVWADTGEPVDLSPIGSSYDPSPPAWTPAHAVSPDNPGIKSRDIRVLKIQMGLKCNYACTYCNQASQPHEVQGGIGDVQNFLRRLPTWFDGGADGEGTGVRIEFWGGEPLVYWKVFRVLAGALRSAYPKARFNIITNGALIDDDKIELLDTLGFSVGISHDGPAMRYRGPDPLDDPQKRAAIRKLYDRLRPWGRIGFNAVLHKHNTSLAAGIVGQENFLSRKLDIVGWDAKTGKRLWRTHTVAQPGDPNRASWKPEESANYGGAPTWMTGTYDPDTDTLFWTTGNPGPDYDGSVRKGDNLYSCSVLALDPATGQMKWYFQYTPHDVHDWDGNQTPVLIDGTIRGQKRKLLVSAQRNAFYYVLDRTTGEFLAGRAFAHQTWAKGLDDKGRPLVLPNTTPTPEGNYVCPDAAGSANWGAPSYDPATNLFIVSTREACAVYTSMTRSPVAGEGFTGGGVEVDLKVGTPGSVRALEATTGIRKWDFPLHAGSPATGVLATAGGVVFASSFDGNLIALDSKTGKYLWHYYTGANIITSPMAYAVNGKQYIAIASQSAIFVFGL